MSFLIHLQKSIRLFIPVALFLILTIRCGQNTQPPEDMVAQVNDHYLIKEQLQYRLPDGLDKETALVLQKDIISKWVENEVLYQAALQEGFKLSPKEEFFIREYGKSLLVQRYLNARLDKEYSVSRQDMEEYYQKHRNEFVRQEDEVHLVHLFVEHRDKVIFKEIDKTDDLSALIKHYYFDEKSTKEQPNGDLGYVPLNILPDNFIRTLKRMKTGAVSKPIKTKDGYHFLQLLDMEKKGTIRELDIVKNQIIFRMKRERREKERERLLKETKNNAQIQTYLSKIKE